MQADELAGKKASGQPIMSISQRTQLGAGAEDSADKQVTYLNIIQVEGRRDGDTTTDAAHTVLGPPSTHLLLGCNRLCRYIKFTSNLLMSLHLK